MKALYFFSPFQTLSDTAYMSGYDITSHYDVNTMPNTNISRITILFKLEPFSCPFKLMEDKKIIRRQRRQTLKILRRVPIRCSFGVLDAVARWWRSEGGQTRYLLLDTDAQPAPPSAPGNPIKQSWPKLQWFASTTFETDHALKIPIGLFLSWDV